MTPSRNLWLAALALLCVLPVAAQHRRDPLNPQEVDQLRDAMVEPDTRLKLYVKFARDRMDAVNKLRSDPKATNRAAQSHDLIADFLAIYDELNDNVDMYVDRKNDIRKPLKAVIEADTEFQAKLRAIKDSVNRDTGEAKQYEFVLNNAIDAVDSSADDHRKTLAEVEEYMKHKKKSKE